MSKWRPGNEIMKWRPENWTYGDGYSKPQRKCLHGKGRVRAFEAGADAMLEVLRTSYVTSSPWTPYDNEMHGTWAMIPDDPQPLEKPERELHTFVAPHDTLEKCKELGYNIPPNFIDGQPQLMICPKVKECGDKCEFPPHTIPHEKETISGWWLNHITGKQEFATINIPPFIKVKIEDNQGYHLQHPASKVIESGYFCKYCGQATLNSVPDKSCWAKEAPNTYPRGLGVKL